ncbi:Stress responsive A/B Barrel Domain protein [Novipirellula galeiformis]|uniref:Stress responsive A/B Barrel Domain protein n=1 Tax=Novipirellula galeiformis TaxID=2528004 RepID=A0A5C6CKR2_9BACT|nr:Dabb family protein [Novipirellula galeiformis]TWU25012.1 Stress responsive A/B Barrel Domain protein [Novipirellula galeiformis]
MTKFKRFLSFAVFTLSFVAAGSLASAADSPVAVAEKPATASNAATASAPQPPSAQEQRVLRHAVFFSFKPSSSQQDIDAVVKAFVALPAKIDSIVDFQWGVNNSPEGLDDGFTHCFLLSFADEAGRDKYLPHPAHKAFGNTLRPHMKDVFVIDYWGLDDADDDQGDDNDDDEELKHAVFFKFKDDASKADVKKVEQAFAALPAKIDSITEFEWGTNNSPETHDDGFTHCFMVTFADDAGRAKYLPHPDHQAFVEVLKPILDKVRVLDFTSK